MIDWILVHVTHFFLCLLNFIIRRQVKSGGPNKNPGNKTKTMNICDDLTYHELYCLYSPDTRFLNHRTYTALMPVQSLGVHSHNEACMIA